MGRDGAATVDLRGGHRAYRVHVIVQDSPAAPGDPERQRTVVLDGRRGDTSGSLADRRGVLGDAGGAESAAERDDRERDVIPGASLSPGPGWPFLGEGDGNSGDLPHGAAAPDRRSRRPVRRARRGGPGLARTSG